MLACPSKTRKATFSSDFNELEECNGDDCKAVQNEYRRSKGQAEEVHHRSGPQRDEDSRYKEGLIGVNHPTLSIGCTSSKLVVKDTGSPLSRGHIRARKMPPAPLSGSFVMRNLFPSFGRGFDSHRRYHHKSAEASRFAMPAYDHPWSRCYPGINADNESLCVLPTAFVGGDTLVVGTFDVALFLRAGWLSPIPRFFAKTH
jgi:hypothetical protein